MKRDFNPLTPTEEELMDLLWSSDKPLTSVDIMEQSKGKSWSGSYIHKMLRLLFQKGYLKEVGTKQYNKQYARQFVPAINKHEFYAKFVVSKGIDKRDIGKIAVAIAKESDDHMSNVDLITELELLIDKLQDKDE